MPRQLASHERVTHFADLRPSNTHRAVSEWFDDEGKLYEVVAVAVVEFVPPISREPEQKTQYYYKSLDANADEIADSGPFDEPDEALAMLGQDAPGVEWEALPVGGSVTRLRERLSRSPGQ